MIRVAIFSLAAVIGGCATSTGTSWNDATVEELERGMTKDLVLARFGEPTSQSVSADVETLIFKRPSDEGKAVGKYLSIMTLGVRGGENAVTVDALRVELKKGVVSDYEYSQNVDNNFGQAGQK
jgi:hypothetical protein